VRGGGKGDVDSRVESPVSQGGRGRDDWCVWFAWGEWVPLN